ncbi:hypothetical protein HG531_013686 [Fusarium graminearum]|nr:hypothetical protein HG531_013686 [Fusarium graminearum]
MLGQVEFTSITPSFLAQKELLRCHELDSRVVGKVPIRAAKILRHGRDPVRAFAYARRATPCIADKDALLQIDFGLRDVVVLADLFPHTNPRLSIYIVLGRRVDAGRKIETIEDGATLLLELGNSFLRIGLGSLVLCIKV